MKTFWSKNPWAKDTFSKLMTKSWAKQKELMERGFLNEPVCTMTLIPEPLIKKIAESKNIAPQDIEDDFSTHWFSNAADFIYYHENRNEATAKSVSEFFKENPDVSSEVAQVLTIGLYKSVSELCNYEMQGKRRGISAIFILQQIQNAPITKNGGYSTNTLRNICNTVADQAYENKYYGFSDMLNRNINEAYKLIHGKNIDDKVKIMKDTQEEAYKKYEMVPKG